MSIELEQGVRNFQNVFFTIEKEIGNVIVGMEHVVRGALSAVFAGGHALMEGVPGLGKTLLVKSINDALGLNFKRIQFTPDLMPTDVTGTQVLTEDEHGRRQFVFKPGPIFANIVLADEINRATPKTQAALLEAMEERQITVLDETHTLDQPFFVLATQNPIELEGTYPLPEAQLDRFLCKVMVPAPSSQELKEILRRTTGAEKYKVRTVFSPEEAPSIIQDMKLLVRKVVVADPMLDIVAQIMTRLTPGSRQAADVTSKYVRFGPGPRGAQAVLMLSKVQALLDGRLNVSFEDISAVLISALRHRLILNFQAEADSVSADDVIQAVLSK